MSESNDLSDVEILRHYCAAMNKDEAQRCINIAKRCISEGNNEKAEKFLKKSLALHESSIAKGLYNFIDVKMSPILFCVFFCSQIFFNFVELIFTFYLLNKSLNQCF